MHKNILWSGDSKQITNSGKLQNSIDSNKPSIYGDTSQQLYYYTTNKSNSYKASEQEKKHTDMTTADIIVAVISCGFVILLFTLFFIGFLR